jgi:hypothetical protein
VSWLHRVLGKDGTTQLAVEATHFAARVSGRPMELGTRGAYSAAFYTGVLPAALAANSEIFQFRFVHATLFALLRSLRVSAAVSTTAFAAGVPISLEARVARAWTGQGTLGTGITFGSNDAKKRTDFATTVLGSGDVRIATTAALGAGTKTLDGVPLGQVCAQVGTSITTIIAPGTILWQRDSMDEYPFLLENQEGVVVRSVEVPATGTWKAAVHLEWSEIDPAAVDGWV